MNIYVSKKLWIVLFKCRSTYSQTAPALNLQVFGSQQAESVPPGSQSSPVSLIPLPHICNEVVFLDPGSILI
jgi:hypothetical protein